MKVFIAGATGATGSLLAEQLLDSGAELVLVVRNANGLPQKVKNHPSVSVKEASFLNLSDNDVRELIQNCDAIASCLGHNISFKGIYGKPRRLVRDSIMKLCRAIELKSSNAKVKFVLMNTAGNRNRDLNEPVSIRHRLVIAILRALLPPHPDNEQAADFLRSQIGNGHRSIEWVAVRPDDLADHSALSDYEVHPSPIQDAIFNAGTTSRINVAHFMAELITNSETWQKWKGQMPVIYNRE